MKSDGRPEYLLDRVNPDLLSRAGAFADVEIERPGNYVGDGSDDEACPGAGRDDEKQHADDSRALQRDGCQQDRILGTIEAGRFARVLIPAEKTQRILRPPGEKADLEQLMRRRDQCDDAQRVFIDDMRPYDHRDQLEQRSDELRGQIEQGVS